MLSFKATLYFRRNIVFENMFLKEICFRKQYFFENNLIYYFISFIKNMIFMFLKKYRVFKEILFSKIYFQRKHIFENNISSKRILFTILYHSLFQKHDVHVFKQFNKIIMVLIKLLYVFKNISDVNNQLVYRSMNKNEYQRSPLWIPSLQLFLLSSPSGVIQNARTKNNPKIQNDDSTLLPNMCNCQISQGDTCSITRYLPRLLRMARSTPQSRLL